MKKRRSAYRRLSSNKPAIKRLNMEISFLFAANEYQEYASIPRNGEKRFHPLKGEYRGCFATGISERHRFITKPNVLDFKKATQVEIVEHAKDYH